MQFRPVRIVNASIALLLVLVVIAVYWYAVRPLPKTAGEIEAPIRGSATIKRDGRGVPHIEASFWQDAIFLQGFVTAQDRLWQMDALRRFGAGELAEVFGPSALAADEQSRRMRIRAIAEANVGRLRPEDREVMVEYARGVNYFIDTHRGDYSLEFSLPGHAYDPRPWTLTDTMVVALDMFRDLTDTASFEFDKGVLLAGGVDATKMRLLFPAIQGYAVSPGSNAWAVAGSHTGDGQPLLANDPHLTFGIPSTWHMVHLKAPGVNVSGAALPGIPCVITGHNDQIAWGMTNTQVDVMDLYSEQIDQRTGRYAYRGAVQQAQLDRETIGVKGQKPVTIDTWVTRHGPVTIQANGKSYSMRWSAADGFGFPLFDIDRAKNWEEFRAAVERFWGPGQNFVYADRNGNIGYQASGGVPIRRNFDGDMPLDGSTGQFEWDGYIPFAQLPSFYNPASGMIATANQNPFPRDYAYRVDGSFHDRYRIEQVRVRLRAKNKLTVRDMLNLQMDIYSAYDHYLAQSVVAAYTRAAMKDKALGEAVEILRRWNGQMNKGEAAPMIAELLSLQMGNSLVTDLVRGARDKRESEKNIGRAVATEAAKGGGRAGNVAGRLGDQPKNPGLLPRPEIMEGLLRNRPAGWVANDDWDRWLLRNLAVALQMGRERQGSPMAKWRWGRLLEWKLTHPVGKQLPLVDAFFNIGPVEMSGSGTTVKQTTATLGPSERMVVDVGNWDKSVQNLTVGESGHVASRHYRDEWRAYYTGTSFPMEFEHISATDVLRVKPKPW